MDEFKPVVMLVMLLVVVVVMVEGVAPELSCVFSTEVLEEHVESGERFRYEMFQVGKAKQATVGTFLGSSPGRSTATLFVDDERTPRLTVVMPFMERQQCAVLPVKSRVFCPLMVADSQLIATVPCPSLPLLHNDHHQQQQQKKECDVWQFVNSKLNDTWLLEKNTSNVVRRIIVLPMMGTTVVKTHLYWSTDVPDDSHFVAPKSQPCVDFTTQPPQQQRSGKKSMFEHSNVMGGAVVGDKTSAFEMVNSQNVINKINKHSINNTWKAGINRAFDGMTFADIQQMLTWIPSTPKQPSSSPQQQQHANNNMMMVMIPDEFDARKEWKRCSDTIGTVRDQLKCGACWAFASSEVMADRLCIKQKTPMMMSPQWMVSCFKDMQGCKGGWSDLAWGDMVRTGVVTEDCLPYNATDGIQCPTQQCVDGSKLSVVRALGAYSPYKAWDTAATAQMIQQEIMARGSVVVTIWCFSDFVSYTTGIYQRTPEASFMGMHVVKLIGWGSSPQPHWIGVNSWGPKWGQEGLFLIKRGSSELGIEEQAIAGFV